MKDDEKCTVYILNFSVVLPHSRTLECAPHNKREVHRFDVGTNSLVHVPGYLMYRMLYNVLLTGNATNFSLSFSRQVSIMRTCRICYCMLQFLCRFCVDSTNILGGNKHSKLDQVRPS